MRVRTLMSKDNLGWLKDAKRVEWCPEEVKKNIEKAQDKYKRYFDDVHKSKEIRLYVGDDVRVKSKGRYVVMVSLFSNASRSCWLHRRDGDIEAFENGTKNGG
ncbi:hypothetical protein NDU88_006724 [Pleurodeles waltl]|uniref:Uncharacterized protein n=1 Tax=Pleurodeles waltl TaxID=8319 RepID=A0AAV7PS35_PLEWA|nr:hypothetical protein NDU88_006724 [Pleurodeles waltl]